MQRKFDILLAASASVALASLALSQPVRAESSHPACQVPFETVRLNNPLQRTAQRLTAGQPVTIVAIGSSSTAGAGASSPERSYPRRLAAELAVLFPQRKIAVLNRGIGGQVIGDMLARFDKAVLAEQPDLVLWQLGTNSVMRNHPLTVNGIAIRDGLSRLKARGIDVVLIDPQFAPKVIVKPDAEKMVAMIAELAKEENVELFHRFAVMRRWREVNHLPFETFLSPDGLHMNDWSYGCLAKALGAAIAEAATRPVASASAERNPR